MGAEILVTGATGTIGRSLVKELIRRDAEVRAGIHTPEKTEFIRMPGVEPVKLEFGDLSTLDKALEGIRSVFLLTPFAREQVEFVRRVVDRAKLFGVTHVVRLSMMGAHEEPGTRFTRWHRQAEHYIMNSGLPFTHLRPNALMQNFLRYVQPSGNFIYLPLDGARVSYVDVRDVAAVAAEVLLAPGDYLGRTLEITGPEALNADDIADLLTSVVDSHIGYVSIPEATALHIMESLGTPAWMAEGMVEGYGLQRLGRHERVSTCVQDVLGRKAISFRTFARDFQNVFKAIVQQEHHTYLR